MAEKKNTAKKKSGAGRAKKNIKTQAKKSPNGKKTEENAKKKNPQRRAVLYLVIAAFMLCLILIRGENVWSTVRSFVFGVFGFSSLLLPVFFGYLTYLTVKEASISLKNVRLLLAGGIIYIIDVLFFLFANSDTDRLPGYFETLSGLYMGNYLKQSPFVCKGGLISGVLGYPLIKACGYYAAISVAVIVLTALVLLITGISLSDIFRVVKKPVDAVARRVSDARQASAERRQIAIEEENRIKEEKKDRPVIDIKIDDGPVSNRKKESNNFRNAEVVNEEETGKALSDPESRLNSALKMTQSQAQGADLDPASVMADILNREKNQYHVPDTESKAVQEDEFDISDIPVQRYNSPAAEKSEKKTKLDIEDDIENESDDGFVPPDKAKKEPAAIEKKYIFPPVQLLNNPPQHDDTQAMNELQSNAAKLINTLKSFGVGASIINICRGPSVTRYELQPAPGVKISRITNLADDIALNLAADRVRIEAPIPGKAAVGIEVPNKTVTTVSIRELIDSDEFRNGKSKLTCVLGKDISGNIVSANLADMPHLLIAGTTGSGKSVCVNSILLSILYKARPDEVKLLLIDPKMVEFSKYKGIPHLLVPVVSDAKKAAGALNWAVTEMLQRYTMFSEYDCKNIHGFNQLVQSNIDYIENNPNGGEDVCMEINGLPVPKEKMPQIVIAIDELADLMMAAPNEVEESICRLAQMARAAGMHLVIATQRPSVNVITGVIKANIPSRIALKVSSQIDSRTILDFGGAEKLIGKGDMLFAPVGAPKPLRVQGCFASDDEIEKVAGFIKSNYNAQYNAEIEEKIRKIAAEDIAFGKKGKGDNSSQQEDSELDAKMEEAIRCVIEAGQASTSMLQRKLSVGYARAGRMIDDMEQMGIVGPYQGSKPRAILMTYNEWLERNHILSDTTDDE